MQGTGTVGSVQLIVLTEAGVRRSLMNILFVKATSGRTTIQRRTAKEHTHKKCIKLLMKEKCCHNRVVPPLANNLPPKGETMNIIPSSIRLLNIKVIITSPVKTGYLLREMKHTGSINIQK